MSNRRLPIALAALIATLWAAAAPAADDFCSPGEFKDFLETIVGTPLVKSEMPGRQVGAVNRLAGRVDGSLRAAVYVHQQLGEISRQAARKGQKPLEIFTQDVPVVQPLMTECQLTIDGKTLPLHAVRPNLLQASITVEEGLTAKTIYVGRGDVVDYKNADPSDKIVVMDFNAGANWLTAFSFGARAVIFVGDMLADGCDHHINMPANMPRFYATGEAAKLLRTAQGREVTIKAAATWQPLRGRNVIAVIRGTDPTFAIRSRKAGSAGETVVLAAGLDTYGEVPEVTPGARDGGNVVALLEIARYLTFNRPKRDVIVCFFDGQAQSHAGARAFYGAISRENFTKSSVPSLEDRLDMIRNEREFIEAAAEFLVQDQTADPDLALIGAALPLPNLFDGAPRAAWLSNLAAALDMRVNVQANKVDDSALNDAQKELAAALRKQIKTSGAEVDLEAAFKECLAQARQRLKTAIAQNKTLLDELTQGAKDVEKLEKNLQALRAKVGASQAELEAAEKSVIAARKTIKKNRAEAVSFEPFGTVGKVALVVAGIVAALLTGGGVLNLLRAHKAVGAGMLIAVAAIVAGSWIFWNRQQDHARSKDSVRKLIEARDACYSLEMQIKSLPALRKQYEDYLRYRPNLDETPISWFKWLPDRCRSLADATNRHQDRFRQMLREEARQRSSEKLKELRPLRVTVKRLGIRIRMVHKTPVWSESLKAATVAMSSKNLPEAAQILVDVRQKVEEAREQMEWAPLRGKLELDSPPEVLAEWATTLQGEIATLQKQLPDLYRQLYELTPEDKLIKEEYDRLSGELRQATQPADKYQRMIALQPPDPKGPIPPADYPFGTNDRLEGDDLSWNGVQALIHERETPEEGTATLISLFKGIEHLKQRQRVMEIIPQRFSQLVSTAVQSLEMRTRELDQMYVDTLADRQLRQAMGPRTNTIVLHLSLSLGDARTLWGFYQGEHSQPNPKDNIANYSAIYKAIRSIDKSRSVKAPDFDPRSVDQTYNQNLFVPAKIAASGTVASSFGILNVTITTMLDPMNRQGQPGDTLEALNVPHMYAQASQVAPFLGQLLDDSRLGNQSPLQPDVGYAECRWINNKTIGSDVGAAAMGGAMRREPCIGAVMALLDKGKWRNPSEVPSGYNHAIQVMTDSQGMYEIGPVMTSAYGDMIRIGAMFKPTRSSEDATMLPGPRGLITSITNQATVGGAATVSVDLFECRHFSMVNYGPARGIVATTAMRALSTSGFDPTRSLTAEFGSILTLYAPLDTRGIKLFNPYGVVLLNNAPTAKEYYGRGIPLSDPFAHPPTSLCSAQDMRILNEYRLKLLRDNRITQESLEVLNGKALDLEEQARKGGIAASTDRYYGLMAAAAGVARRPYGPLKDVMNDLVTAVVLLLLLAMPFAFALERLLIGTPHIYRQIAWFSVFFITTFAVLYLVNPAFKLASTPIIIFLAFSIIILSTLVIVIMVRKLQTEIKKMQGLASTVHSADVSRLSTMMAAVNMGISTMRRRPLRTALTATTVLLLTFTILTFASFGNSWDLRSTYEGPMSGGPERILIHHPLWSPIDQGSYDSVRGALSGQALTVPRYWVAPTAAGAQAAAAQGSSSSSEMLLSDLSTQKLTPVAAAIGLEKTDLDRQPMLAEMFASGAKLELLKGNGIFLTDAVRKELRLENEDIGKTIVLLRGVELVYAGVVRDAMQNFTMLEGSSMLPVDYEASGGANTQDFTRTKTDDALAETPDIESAQFVHFNVDRVVVVSPETARKMGGLIRSMAIYPHKAEQTQAAAKLAAYVLPLPVYYGEGGGVYRLIFTSLTKASGVKDLLIPVILGGLIIFATMLGSVSDREREIYTFSSLGLAPPHVASLFFAEASMYAIIGGMGGYLLGQIVARILGILSGYGIVPPLDMNYSSTNAIVTILIVMGTVLVSTIYPAVKASRSANPGIQRHWRIPKPLNNLYDLVFPFTVSSYDITGVVSFLKEHFDNFSDTSMGVFATTSSAIIRQSNNDMLGFEAAVALAPFDLGVNQKFALLSQPSDIEGIDEVRIMIYRVSGSQGDWQRANRVFINDLRKQLLIWRSLTPEIMDEYRRKTLQGWDGLSVKLIDGQTIGESA
ncbi:MAG: FtsX-like permease family protein [Planctomycetaceae bacterium]|nr:M28 family peptidase [Planctomycetaceae bacterium]